jgi:hypothetical protein
MDRLIGKSGCLPAEREAQFSALRSKIEEIASNIYDLENPSHVYIFFRSTLSFRWGSGGAAASTNAILGYRWASGSVSLTASLTAVRSLRCSGESFAIASWK